MQYDCCIKLLTNLFHANPLLAFRVRMRLWHEYARINLLRKKLEKLNEFATRQILAKNFCFVQHHPNALTISGKSWGPLGLL